jgi:hypothetical protein
LTTERLFCYNIICIQIITREGTVENTRILMMRLESAAVDVEQAAKSLSYANADGKVSVGICWRWLSGMNEYGRRSACGGVARRERRTLARPSTSD